MATDRVSSYVAHLPALLQEDAFVGRFLLAFERILSGLHPPDPADPFPQQAGLEDILDRIHTYFAPEQTPADFLPWLASWVTLSLREDWDEEETRRFISRIVPLYQYRGTKYGLEQILETYTNEDATIYEFDHPPHYFQVVLTLSQPTPERRRSMEKIALAIIDQEKPAHTFYKLQILFPSMQIRNDGDDPKYPPNTRGVWIGRTTTLGTTSETGGR